MKSKIQSRIWIGITAAAVLIGTLLIGRQLFLPQPPTAGGPAGPNRGPVRFELIDHTGQSVTQDDYRGRHLLVYFGYSHCPDVCPVGLSTIGFALRQPDVDAGAVQPLFITVDPKRDTVSELADYVPAFHPRMVGLTGTEAQIADAARAFGAVYFTGEVDGSYVVDHSAFTYLVGPDGALLETFPHGISSADLAAALRRAL